MPEFMPLTMLLLCMTFYVYLWPEENNIASSLRSVFYEVTDLHTHTHVHTHVEIIKNTENNNLEGAKIERSNIFWKD